MESCYTMSEQRLLGGSCMTVKEIDTTDLADKLSNGEELHIIDVREDDEVEQGMIPNAQHIKLGDVPERLDELDAETHYYIICRSGARSLRAAQYLEAKGYQATNVDGGMLAWKGETIIPE